MQIINAPVETAKRALADNLRQLLRYGKKVLWLVPGGSNLEVVVWVMNQLHGIEDQLTIMLVDERYGPLGHKDSNWLQLAQAGFNSGQATAIPSLVSGLNLSQTAKHFAVQLNKAFNQADVYVGFFGIGDDGHIAGILPHTEAAKESSVLACGYHTDQFDRITMTFSAIKKMDVAFCLAYGSSKRQPLVALKSSNVSPAQQPSQILKVIPTAYVYNDQIA